MPRKGRFVGRLALVVLASAALLSFGSVTRARAAPAGGVIGRAATALSTSSVYVDPDAEKTIGPAEAARLRNEIEASGGGPIYVAVLPDAAVNEAGGDAAGVAAELHRLLGRPGVYAVVAGGHFRALASDLPAGKAGKLATAAFNAHHSEGIGPTLTDFVDRVGHYRRNGDSQGGIRHLLGRIPTWLIIAIVIAGFSVVRGLGRRRRRMAQFGEVKETAHQDLVALAEDVEGLEQKVEANAAAKKDYDAAIEQYGRASSAFDSARNPQELAPVAVALDEGRYLMASAEARVAGKEPPERRPPCFFDPRHGPSVRDVEWSPHGGATRKIPACAACAVRVEAGEEPDSRQVIVRGRSRPYWNAGPGYGGYYGGFFPGLAIGSLGRPSGSSGGSMGDFFGGRGGDFGSGGDFGGGSSGGGGGGSGGGGGDF